MSLARRQRRLTRKAIEQSGDRCGACGTPYGENTKTFVGITPSGAGEFVEVGECCLIKLSKIAAVTLFGRGPRPDFVRAGWLERSYSPEEAFEIVCACQERIARGG